MIVDAAVLANFPANGHALEEVILENEIPRVIPSGEEQIFVERFGPHSVADDVVLNIFESEVALGYCSKAFDPVGDAELFNGKFFWHGRKIITPNDAGWSRQRRKY
jgi:hypothetical protein